MSNSIMESQLLAALNGDATLATHGYVAVASDATGISVRHNGEEIGVWRWRNGAFELLTAAPGEPALEFETVAEAVHYTREHLAGR